jgi:1A family penicillin-binding protein
MSFSNYKKPNQSWRNQKYSVYQRPVSAVRKPSTVSSLRTRNRSGKGAWLFIKTFVWSILSNKSLMKKIGIIAAIGIFAAFVWLARISSQLPSPDQLIDREVAQTTKILDRTGQETLYEVHGDEKRTLVKLNEIPNYVKWATISIEDKDFYNHGAFSIWAMFRTAVTNIFTGQKAGGSTLTQQFIKNAILTNEKTYTRKIKELILSYRLEEKFSKDEILQMYFNEIPYGSNAYGVEAASQKYFGKSVRDVNLAEAAVLAALPQAPSRYSPYGPNRELLLGRQQYIIDQMEKQGYLTKEKADAAKEFKIEFQPPKENITAPHFVMYVKEMLAEKYGEKAIEQDGLKIYTTLDTYKQKIAEEAVAAYAEKNEQNYNAKNASLVSIDPKTGEILAMVGSKDFFNEAIDGQVNVATSLRQPGSSIKPLVYATAFEKGYNPNTIVYDVLTNFSADPSHPYEPHNYNGKDNGPVSLRKALAGSLNVPAVKTLYLAGINNVIENAKNLGYSSLNDPDRVGLSLVLGGGEVKLLEHTNAFSAYAREGYINPTVAILKVEDKEGNILEEKKDMKPKKVLEANVAKMINSILSDNGARSYIFGEKNYLTLGSRPVAAKTGTTNDFHDAWTIGYTPSIVTGVWVGNSDNEAMKPGSDGSILAAPIWNYYMKKVLGDTPIEYFNEPDIKPTGKAMLDGNLEALDTVRIDRASGLLATELTPESFIEEKSYKQPHCILYYIKKDDPLGDPPKDPASDPQFNLWESRIQAWAAKQNIATTTPPTEFDNLHIPANLPQIELVAPGKNQNSSNPNLNAEVKVSANRGVNRIEYYIDDNLIAINNQAPFSLNKNISFLSGGFHTLKARACDDIDNCSEASVTFNYLGEEKTTEKISIQIDTPGNGVSLNGTNFPLPVRLNLQSINSIGRIDLYLIDKDNNSKKVSTLAQPSSNSIDIVWNQRPYPGDYKIFAEAIGWQGQKEKTEEISLVVNP